MKNCVVVGGTRASVFVSGEEASLNAEGCIFHTASTAGSGLLLQSGAVASLNSCRIDSCGRNGVEVYDSRFEALYSSISSNGHSNVCLEEGAYGDLYRCQMNDSSGSQGVYVEGEGTEALISACDVCRNFASNVAVQEGAVCTLQGGTYNNSSTRKGWWVEGEGSKLVASNGVA